MKQASGEPKNAHTGIGDNPMQPREVYEAIRINDELGAVEKGSPDFEGRCIEGERRNVQQHVIRANLDVVRSPGEAWHVEMGNADPSGSCGRACRGGYVSELVGTLRTVRRRPPRAT